MNKKSKEAMDNLLKGMNAFENKEDPNDPSVKLRRLLKIKKPFYVEPGGSAPKFYDDIRIKITKKA